MKVERCVVDTNVLISALLQPSGRTAADLDAIRAIGSALIFSDETFAELAARLARSKFDRYVDQVIRRQFLSDLAAVAEWVAITGTVQACRDRDDDKFLETAVRGEADCIVTGDRDLLACAPGARLVTAGPGKSVSAADLWHAGSPPPQIDVIVQHESAAHAPSPRLAVGSVRASR